MTLMRKLVGLGFLVLAVSCSTWLMRRTTTGDIDALLQSTIRAGSHHTRVTAVLDSIGGIEHTEYDDSKRVIFALWPRTSVRLFDESAIQARFYFDVNGNLIRYELEEQITAV